MSEEKNHDFPANSDRQQGNNGQNRSNRRRHHKGGNRPRPDLNEKEPRTEQKSDTPQQNPENASHERKASQAGAQNGNREHGQNNKPKKNDGKNRGDQKGRNDNRRTNNRGGKHGQERRPYDPYETPNKEEIELSELRARIVLKSADGTAPVPFGMEKANDEPTPEQLAEAQAAADAILNSESTPAATAEQERVEVVGVRFRSSGKTYYFDPHGLRAKKGEYAIVETTRGPEFGEVSLGNCMVNANETVTPLRPLLRIATPADIAHNTENREKEKEALAICHEKIKAHKLDMKLIDVQYAFDNSKLLFYFSSEGRVDFRELVKDLASVFRTRIELRQIGIRDEAKMLGGIGACGRALCCSTFLPDFAQVSIKMAKEQNLSLNTTKISGVCGRLMCCLRYESEVYTEEIKKTPSNDTLVRTEDGVGVVIGSNPLAGTVRVVLKESPDTAPKQYHRDNVTVLGKEHRTEQAKGGKARDPKHEKEAVTSEKEDKKQ